MGGQDFDTISLGRTADQAYSKAVDDALYYSGHGGYTGTIAEKSGYVFFGQLSPRYSWERFWDILHNLMELQWHGYWETLERDKAGNIIRRIKHRKSPVPPKLRHIFKDRILTVYEDKWGPAVCVELNPQETRKFKKSYGRSGTKDRTFLFCGVAST